MFSSRQSANLFATIRANDFAGNRRKIVCMTTRGQIVREWRIARGLKPLDVANMAGTSRQNIENFELDKVKFPRYLPKLAKAMGYARADDLLALKPPPGLSPEGVHPQEGTSLQRTGAQNVSPLTPMIDPITIPWESIVSFMLSQPLPALFKVVIEDDAMAPEFPRGCVVTFSTEEGQPRAKDAVLVVDADGALYFREYQVGRGARWQAVALSSGYQPLSSEADGLKVVAISMGRWGRRG